MRTYFKSLVNKMNITEEEIVDMYNNGRSTYQLAKENNTYPNKIRRILHKHGIELKTRSEAQKNAIVQGVTDVPTKGKKRTREEKLNISKGLKQMWESMSEDTYKEYVNRSKVRWDNMSEEEKQNMSQAAIKAIQVAGREGSKVEKFLFSELTKNGYVVEFHKKNLIANKNLEIDMYIPACKTIIEIDGPSHFLPIWGEEKLQKQIKADDTKTGLILSKGFVIIRIKNLIDRMSLLGEEKLRKGVLDILNSVRDNFPEKTEERYIEVEIC